MEQSWIVVTPWWYIATFFYAWVIEKILNRITSNKCIQEELPSRLSLFISAQRFKKQNLHFPF